LYFRNELNSNAEVRALELAALLSTLGPSFIKIGQSLSIRTDLLSPEYVRGLKTLQDQVPPFETSIALRILQEEWGSPVESILSEISSEPVAAASLGQVYRARLLETGQEVAIKVLRPNIEGQIALDMYILRELAPFVKRTFNLNTDLGGVVDTWGAGFVDELDYLSEAENSKDFMKGIEKTELKDVVFAPPVVDKLSTEKILTTEWIIGERLDRSNTDDVTALCSVAMNTYLTMMLELGTLHRLVFVQASNVLLHLANFSPH
jgi:predicted unusual protein kinase regulating ubiquinone biosynthesis (AarF/ABC1/UbiB family)